MSCQQDSLLDENLILKSLTIELNFPQSHFGRAEKSLNLTVQKSTKSGLLEIANDEVLSLNYVSFNGKASNFYMLAEDFADYEKNLKSKGYGFRYADQYIGSGWMEQEQSDGSSCFVYGDAFVVTTSYGWYAYFRPNTTVNPICGFFA